MMSAKEIWQELIEKADRTSPGEYPDMALISFDELSEIIAALDAFAKSRARAEVEAMREALHAATFAKIEIDTDCVTLYIDVDVKALIQLIEYEKATAK